MQRSKIQTPKLKRISSHSFELKLTEDFKESVKVILLHKYQLENVGQTKTNYDDWIHEAQR